MSARVPFPTSVCHTCRYVALIASATSTFVRCNRPGYPKYPPQPVRFCNGHEPKPAPPPQGSAN
ncbi:MAG: hypothetical protein ABL997_13550 [Planctomycetota bacterium]